MLIRVDSMLLGDLGGTATVYRLSMKLTRLLGSRFAFSDVTQFNGVYRHP